MNSSSSSPSDSADRLKALVSELRFGSFLVYPTRGESDLCKKACRIVTSIKEDKVVDPSGPLRMPEYTARRLREELPKISLEGFLPQNAILVPMPKSAIHYPDSLWPAQRICEALLREGFGNRIAPLIERAITVKKSAHSKDRPKPLDHYRSFKLKSYLLPPDAHFVLVDDVITKGSTMLGAACRIQEAFPRSKIMGFAIARTRGHVTDIPDVMDPFVGKVVWHGEDAKRED